MVAGQLCDDRTSSVYDICCVRRLSGQSIEIGVGAEPEEHLVEYACIYPRRPIVQRLEVVAGFACDQCGREHGVRPGVLYSVAQFHEVARNVVCAELHPVDVIVGNVERALAVRLLERHGHRILVSIGDDAMVVLIAQYEFYLHSASVRRFEDVHELARLLRSDFREGEAEVQLLSGMQDIRAVPGKTAVFRVHSRKVGHRRGDFGVVPNGAMGVHESPRFWAVDWFRQEVEGPTVYHSRSSMPGK